jgi:phosphoadenosine phosphosulfate reductase
MPAEPLLRPEDDAEWSRWQIIARQHARTRKHASRVDRAKRIVDECLTRAPNAAVMWSGGKDSTVLTHLVCVEMGRALPVFSEKDDLDFPGERAYVETWAARWKIDLRVLVPDVSPLAWVEAHRAELVAGDDLHSRAAGLSKACFYEVVERATETFDAVLLGLRSEESRGRRMNRALRGPTYQKTSGQWVCSPLVDWSGIDVMAYLAARDIDPLPLYRCIAFAHAREPWRVRKSWWLPGQSSNHGQMAWLRHYWPSLYELARELVIGAQRMS